MRDKGEIISDAHIAIEKPASNHQSYIKLTILTLDVLIDIRDELNEMNNNLASVEKIIHRDL